MAGKAYTMREMKNIVEYLTEHKAYGEIKGRKMWMEFSNSQHTTRSWQSLKETFLKRILPDLHNPYYKLSMEQVRSFRQGYDVAEMEKNRLEIRTTSQESNANDKTHNRKNLSKATSDNDPSTSCYDGLPTTGFDNEPSTTNIENEMEKATGETTSAKIASRNRSSADTLVLEYENAEDIQRELESPQNKDKKSNSKSLKDLLSFEPMTPLVKELLDDFETESESSDKEPQLKIVEETSENSKKTDTDAMPMRVDVTPVGNGESDNDVKPIVIQDSDDLEPEPLEDLGPILAEEIAITENQHENNKQHRDLALKENQDKSKEPLKHLAHAEIRKENDKPQKDNLQIKIQEKNDENQKSKPEVQKDKPEDNNNDVSKAQEVNQESVNDKDITNNTPQDTTEFVTAETSNVITLNENKTNVINNTGNSIQNTGNTSSDTILPNNQEGLDDSNKSTQNANLDKTTNEVKKVENNKRSSHDDTKNKKPKLSDDKTSEADDIHGRVTPVIELYSETPSNGHDTASIVTKNTEIPNNRIIEINTDTPTTEITEVQFNTHLNPENNPSTSTQKNVPDVSTNEDKNAELDGDKNPCLLSVSLYDEQFKNTKYSDDSDEEATPAPNHNEDKDKTETSKKIEEKSHKEANVTKKLEEVIQDPNKDAVSESSTDNDLQKQRTTDRKEEEISSLCNKALTLQREKALANVFGFAHGAAASTSRKRHLSHRRSHHRRRRRYSRRSSNSSEWTSESDSEAYVSPPRGRKNRQTRKYLKPKSSRLLQDPEEGMLFVMFGKDIYPLVKDGKQIKNFLTYRPDSGSDMEEEAYWKQKYIEEKKRVNEFKKMLKGDGVQDVNDRALHSSPRNSTGTTRSPQKPVQNGNANEFAAPAEAEPEVKVKEDKLVLKIASKNGLEYCLEGGWTQISNAMPQVVQSLRSESNLAENKINPSPGKKANNDRISFKSEEALELSSGISTPVYNIVDPEVHEKVNVIETEIFKEIEKREKEEETKQNEVETTNVTTRRGRPRKESSSSVVTAQTTPAKRTRASKASTESKDAKPVSNKRIKQKQEEESTVKPAKSKRASNQKEVTIEKLEPKQNEIEKTTRAKSKAKTDTVEVVEQKIVQNNMEPAIDHKLEQDTKEKVAEEQTIVSRNRKPSRRESLRLSKQREIGEKSNVGSSGISPSQIRSSSRQTITPRKYDTDSSASDTRTRTKKSTSKDLLFGLDDEDARYMFPPTPKTDKVLPKETRLRRSPRLNKLLPENSSNSSIDQGYQDSDTGPMLISLSKRKRKLSFTAQRKHTNRRVARRKSYPTGLHDLSSDSNSTYFVPLRKSQGSINSDIYRTDSYLQLFPNKKERLSFNKLAPIDETGLAHFDQNIRHFDSVSKESNKSNDSSNIVLGTGSSSNVSLPPSPELSVVEKLSVSREFIKNSCNQTVNEIQSSRNKNDMDLSEYMISNLDVSVPLMDQQCVLQLSDLKTPRKTSQFNKKCTVKVENLSLSQSLDQRLKNLLLESGKKDTRADHLKEHAMEVDGTLISTSRKTRSKTQKEQSMDVGGIIITKTSRGKKTSKADKDKENTLADGEIQIPTMRKTRSKSQKEKEIDIDKTKPTKTKKGKTRSSTPQKKKTVQKAKVLQNTVIEEHMEFCSIGGRRSCPPVIGFFSIDENANNCDDVNLNITGKVTAKKKKDIIRVKIQRPMSRDKLGETSVEKASTTSIYTDSGINDSGNLSGCLLKGNDSVDLIHNHSETCLLANECIGNSVEFVELSKSIISVNSDHQSFDSELKRLFEDAAANMSGEMFSNNKDNAPVSVPKTSDDISQSPETEFFSPATINSSLITDDLSDEPPPQPTKWYLLSEDETTLSASIMGSFGSSLRQIFPVTCTVPDLSTITEASNSNKQSFNSDGKSCHSQSLL